MLTSRRAGVQPRGGAGPAPLAFAQERLWFLDRLMPGSTAYALSVVVRLRGRLDAGALRAAVRELVRRHEVLRSTFPSQDGRPVQVAGPVPRLELPLVDLSGEAEPDAAVTRAAGEELRRPFDLAGEPPLRARFLRAGELDHRLLLVVHHIACDAWSQAVLVRELAGLYEALAAGRPSPLPEPTIQFADFAVWQRERVEQPRLQAHLRHWAERLRPPVATLALAAGRPRPAVPGERAGRHRHELPEGLMAAAHDLAGRLRVTPYVLLLAAFEVLLHRYTGETDVVVGTTTAGRSRPELEGLVGFAGNTLALRTDLGGGPTFRQVVERVRDVVLDALDRAEVPFERIVEAARPDRRLSATPLFQVLFVLQDLALAERRAGDVTIDVDVLDTEGAQFDLMLVVGGRVCWFEYRADLFDAGQVARMAAHYELLLGAAVAGPDRPVAELPLLPEAERRLVLQEWNDTEQPSPDDRCLHDLIAERARQAPDRPAVVLGGAALTYGELEARADRLARLLAAGGVGPEVRVGICLERSIEMIVAMYGVLKAGATYVPLATDTPPERLAFLLRACRAAVVISERSAAGALAAAGASALSLDGDLPDPPAGVVLRPAAPDNAAYVMFTSGSTGEPKGVVVAHRSLCNLWAHLESLYAPAGGDRMLHHLPFTFDMAAFGYLWPLVAGATAVLAPAATGADPDLLIDVIARQGVTILVLAPPQLDLLLERPGLERCASLRCVIAGGDALPATLRDRFLARMRAELHNAYGPTETTIGMTFWPCAPVPWEGSLPIGGPIRNVRTYVLDPRLEAVPVGVRGEIHIGGVAVTRGYLGRPDLTAERFLPDPHSPRPGARMYRSGDLGRWLPDGSLQCLGRVDDQVKLRGIRIEPQEVVARLNRHPAVRESFVCVRELGPGDDRLVAYVAPRDPAAPPRWPDVRAFLAGWLPRHLVPAAMVLLPDLPLRATGKVDRAALPPPVPEPVEAVPDAPPRTELERAIAAAWRDALQVDHVGRDDNFFDLGGHSLLLVRIHDRLRTGLDPELSLLDLFQHPTVAGLAAHVGGRRPAAAGPARGHEAGRRQREALRRAAAARRGGDGA